MAAHDFRISCQRSLGSLFASLARWADTHLGGVEEARRDYDSAGRPLPA